VTAPILSRAAIHSSACYLAFFAALGVHVPFWPLWLRDWGLSAAEVGGFLALGTAARVAGGLVLPVLADRLEARRATLALCALGGALLFVAHHWITGRGVLLVATLAIGVALAGIGPIAEALGVNAARRSGFDYARSRAAGSFGFLASNLVLGAVIAVTGAWIALWTIAVWLIVLALLAPGHPGGQKLVGHAPPSLRQIGRVALDPVFGLFLVTVACVQSSHATIFALGSIHWAELGLGETRIGMLWAFSVLAEIVLLIGFGSGLIRRLGPVGALGGGAVAAMVRWALMATDPAGWLLWPLQSLHALTFGLSHLGAIAFIARAVPVRYGAAAQGAMAALGVGLFMALAMLISAALYPRLGGGTYAIGAVLGVAGLGLAWLLGRRWSGGELAV
jgi:PPP family 3-phenylpropionic acid transporter